MDGALKSPGLIYLHGFCSSPASWKARLLGEAMRERGLAAHYACPALSHVPAEALAGVARLIEAQSPADWHRITLVGSSLGGHYATALAERYGLRAILINPAVVDGLPLNRFIGPQRHFHSGETFEFTAAHADQLRAQCVAPTPARYWLLCEMGDEVLDYRQAVAHYAGGRQTVLPGGDHSFSRFPDYVSQILEFAGLNAKV